MTATASSSPSACPRCGRPLPADAPAGLCPRCLLSDGFGNGGETDFRLRTGGQRFVPPTVEELAAEFPSLEFVRLLGSGGMGAVYLAKQVRLDRPVAVKILPPDLADDPAFAERFLREARALARLSHPNIVGVYDFGQTPGGLYYFLMEYIEGPTLRQVVASRTADPKQALEIVRQVCDALQFAHDKGVVHRDIKPENILLDSRGRVKIADFGLAKLLGLAEPHAGSPAAGSLTGTRQAMGTPHYMAPEQIAGSRGVDHRADIYSLGVVFYELLTGDLPLGRFAPPSKKVRVDVRLDEVVLHTLESEPERRYQRAGDVKTDVETISYAAHRPAGHGAAAMQFVRDASTGTGRAVRSMLEPPGPGELSRKAIVAFAWAATVPLALLCLVLVDTFDHSLDVLAVLFATIGFVLALPTITAPIGTTMLGIAAVREVRRSNGSVTGLVPGLAAALFFPFLLFDLFLWWLVALFLVVAVTGPADEEIAIVAALLLVAPLAAWLNVRITRAAWRKATEGLPPELIERELCIIPPAVRRAVRAVVDWCERHGLSAETLFGRTQAAEPVGSVDNVAAHFAVASAPATPRTSFKAVVGACWAAMLPIGVLLFLFVESTHRSDPVHDLALVLLGLVALPALTAPIAATVLGWMAVGDIRRAAGRVTGLPLAVYDGLFFPLLMADAMICGFVAACTAAVIVAFRIDPPGPDRPALFLAIGGGVLVALILCAVADALIFRVVWRRVKASMPPAPSDVAPVGPTAEPAGESSDAEPVPRRSRRDLIAAAVALGVAAGLFGIKAWHEGWLGEPARPATLADAVPVGQGEARSSETSAATSGGGLSGEGMFTEEEMDRHWRFGPNGPEMSPMWANMALGIDDPTREAINVALRDVYTEYERLLDAHTDFEFQGEAVKFTVEPFEEGIDRLVDEFWSRVDPLLNLEQQKIMRYNFPLQYQRERHALAGTKGNFVMPIGDGRWTIRIEQSGQWYRWSATYPNSPPGTVNSPELPLYLRRFQYQFDRLMSLRDNGLAIDPRRPPLVAPQPAKSRPAAPAMIDPSMLSSAPPMIGPAMPGYEDMGAMPGPPMMGAMPGFGEMGTMPGDFAMGGMLGDPAMGAMPGFGGMGTMPDLGGGEDERSANDGDTRLRSQLQQWGVDPPTIDQIAGIVRMIELEYDDVLKTHTIERVEGDAVTFEVPPFPEKIASLERRFWELVDPLLTVEQQRLLRQNFPVGELPTSGAVIEGNEPAGLMPLGRHGGMQLRIERVGLWYRWKLDLRTAAGVPYDLKRLETPSLPHWLRRFQARFDALVPPPESAP